MTWADPRYWCYIVEEHSDALFRRSSEGVWGNRMREDGEHEDRKVTLQTKAEQVLFDAHKSFPRNVGRLESIIAKETDNHIFNLIDQLNISAVETVGPIGGTLGYESQT